MVRWEPGAVTRLQAAALDLYLSQGYEQTTVADIAQSVGLTERTFFRHFADKREVLFDRQDQLQQAFLDGVAAVPDPASPMQMVAGALRTSASLFEDERRVWSRKRQAVVDANPALLERELLKLESLTTALGEALRGRAVGEPAAGLAARSGVAVFHVAFHAWIAPGETRSLSALAQDALAQLGALTTIPRTGPRGETG